MVEPIKSPDEVTPKRLTRILRDAGRLPEGCVDSVTVTSSKEIFTTVISFLDVAYSTYADDGPSNKLFLKTAKPGNEASSIFTQVFQNEQRYYSHLAPQMSDPPSVPCHDIAISEEAGRFHLLMDDASATHYQSDGLPLPRETCELYVEMMARFHAHWWDHPEFGSEIGNLPGDQMTVYYQEAERMEEALRGFTDFLGEGISDTRVKLYDRILHTVCEMRDLRGRRRLTEAGNLTLIHGDAHYQNMFFPRDPATHRPFFIDWQCWDIRVGTDDLTYPLVLRWFPERRAALEQDLVKRYHDVLLENGVVGYTWEDCWHDYRLSSIRNMLVPPFFWAIGISPQMSWQFMEMAFLNFYDLGCEELLC